MSVSDVAPEVVSDADRPTGATLGDEVARLQHLLAALVRDGAGDQVDGETLDALLAASIRVYAACQQAADAPLPPMPAGSVAPADAILIVNTLLRVANIDPFELALWHSWGKA